MHLFGELGWTALAVVLVIAPLSHATKHVKEDDDCEFSDLVTGLGQLQHRISGVEDGLRERKGPKVLGDLKSLDHKLRQFEEHECRSDSFLVCGFHTNQCVHKLLVCDGIKDCENGFDEKYCDLPFHEGDKYEGIVVFDHCTQRRPKFILFEILKITTDKYKTPSIEATLSMERHGQDFGGTVFTIHGSYDFAEKVLDFYAPETDRLGFVINLQGADANHFDGYIGSFTEDEPCAKFEFKRADYH